MTSKERVHASLRRQSVDHVPVCMWFHPLTARRLSGILEVPPAFVGAAMGDDIRMAFVNNNYAMVGIEHGYDGEGHEDFWGIRWRKEGAFNQPVGFHLAVATREEILAYRFPEEHLDFLLSLMHGVLAEKEHWLRRLAMCV
ncbi:MAG: hypothetical protein ACLQDI_18995 [Syntrophobacteraceae bacterium]